MRLERLELQAGVGHQEAEAEHLEVAGLEVHQEQGEHQVLVELVGRLAEVGEPVVRQAVAELWVLEGLQGVEEVLAELRVQGVHVALEELQVLVVEVEGRVGHLGQVGQEGRPPVVLLLLRLQLCLSLQ